MALRLPPLNGQVAIVDAQGRPTAQYMRFWQTFSNAIVQEVGALQAAQIAEAAAVTAQAAASTATAAANAAQASVDGANATTALVTSTVSGNPISAEDAGTDATIVIDAHDRIYGDGTTAAVDAGSLTGLAYSTRYWVGYIDASRTGGAVTYTASTTVKGNGSGDPSYHFVGAVLTPAALGPPVDGLPNLPPGSVYP